MYETRGNRPVTSSPVALPLLSLVDQLDGLVAAYGANEIRPKRQSRARAAKLRRLVRGGRVSCVVLSASAEVVVRDAIASDAVAIAALGRVAFAELHKGVLPDPVIDLIVQETYSVESLRACVVGCAGDGGAHFLVAYRGNALVGYLHYDSEGQEPELHRIYVDPLQKRAGIGSALLREHHARLPSGTSYVLLVFAANAAAIDFYRAHGLREDARVDAYPFFSENTGVKFPSGTPALPALVMRFTDSAK